MPPSYDAGHGAVLKDDGTDPRDVNLLLQGLNSMERPNRSSSRANVAVFALNHIRLPKLCQRANQGASSGRFLGAFWLSEVGTEVLRCDVHGMYQVPRYTRSFLPRHRGTGSAVQGMNVQSRLDIKKRGSEPLLVSNWDAYNVNAVLAWRLVQVDQESLPSYPVPDCHYCPKLSLAKLQGVRLFTRALGAQQIRVRSRLVG